MQSIFDILKNNPYPGRGIVVGVTPNAKHAIMAYFIMGRSGNSRNRIFVQTADGIMNKAADASKVEDPSLILYTPVKVFENKHIVTNGDQTNTVYDGFQSGKCFFESLKSRTFEPDAPHYTPRISAAINTDDFSYDMSVIKSFEMKGEGAVRMNFSFDKPMPGCGHFIHTYAQNTDPLLSFQGEPICIETMDDRQKFTECMWDSLHEDNKISLFVRYISIERGDVCDIIKNKYEEKGN